MHLSACIEMLFVKETDNSAERIRLAAGAGFDAVEFWRWTNKDLTAIERALAETSVTLAGIVAEPMIPLTDPASHPSFLAGLADTLAVAKRLGARVLITQAGFEASSRPRAEQRASLVYCLKRSADVLEGSGVQLALEPLNTRIDHPGYFLSSTVEGLDIIDEVSRPEIRLTYDIYHSMVMDERVEDVLAGRIDRVAHVHVADHPGRGEPGSGSLPLGAATAWLDAQGYAGTIGFEFRPTVDTVSVVSHARSALGLASAAPETSLSPCA